MTDADLASESALRGFSDPKASDWKSLELFDESSKIQIIERSYINEKHRRYKYKYVGDESSEKDIIVTAPGPDEPLPGMGYTIGFVASVVADKYISHMPLERQTREMESLGLKGRKEQHALEACGLGAACLEKLQEKTLADLLNTDLALQIDETPWKIKKYAKPCPTRHD